MSTVNEQRINKFIALEYILCGVIILATLLQESAIASNAFMMSFLILVVYYLKLIFSDAARDFLPLTLLIVAVSFLCICYSSIINYSSFNFDYIKEYLIFLSTVFFIFIIVNSDINLKTSNAILIFNIFAAYLYPLAYKFFPQSHKYNDLTLNFSNPNLTAMWILQSVLYAALSVFIIKSKLLKIIAAVSIPINVFLINETGARNCMIALVLFAALCAWITIKKSKKFSKSLIFIINIVPIAFVPIYLTYIKSIQERGWFDFLVKEGKSLTSRLVVWQDQLEKIHGLWLTGNYAQASGNAHNAHLVLLSSYGILILILVIYFFYKVCINFNDESKSRKNLFALAAFFAVIFMGLGEGALFSGGMGIFVMACGFLLLARCDYRGSEDEEEKSLVEQAVG